MRLLISCCTILTLGLPTLNAIILPKEAEDIATSAGLTLIMGQELSDFQGLDLGNGITATSVQNTNEEQSFYTELFGSPEATKHYADGNPIAAKTVLDGLQRRSTKWAISPWSSFTVHHNGQMIERMTAGHALFDDEGPGVSEIEAIWIPHKDTTQIMLAAAPALIQWAYFIQQLGEKDLLDKKITNLSGAPVSKLMSTTSADHSFMIKMLEATGFKPKTEKATPSRHEGAEKLYYELSMNFETNQTFMSFLQQIKQSVQTLESDLLKERETRQTDPAEAQ